jgi:hypothetical protein
VEWPGVRAHPKRSPMTKEIRRSNLFRAIGRTLDTAAGENVLVVGAGVARQ